MVLEPMGECEPAFSESTAFSDFSSVLNIAGKRVLEIGGHMDPDIVRSSGVAQWVAIDPLNEDSLSPHYRSIGRPASSIPLPSSYFDLVFSCNAFHHINDLQRTLIEVARVLKPNGRIYSHFGPIWSAPDGSHLEKISYSGNQVNFWTHPYLPSWYHLIYQPAELHRILSSRLPSDLALAIVHYVSRSRWINRLSYPEYITIFESCGCEIEKIMVATDFGYEFSPPKYDNPFVVKAERWLERLRLPEFSYHRYRDLKVILRKW